MQETWSWRPGLGHTAKFCKKQILFIYKSKDFMFVAKSGIMSNSSTLHNFHNEEKIDKVDKISSLFEHNLIDDGYDGWFLN
jgi:hypothetical protein